MQLAEPAADQAVDDRLAPAVGWCIWPSRPPCGTSIGGRLMHGGLYGWLATSRARALRRGPRRRGRGQREEREADERQRDEAQRPAVEVAPAAQPQHRGGHVGQEEERDVAQRDEHLPPLHLRIQDVLLQPHRRLVPEEHDLVDVDLRVPPGRHAERVGEAAQVVVGDQHERERQEVEQDEEDVALADAPREQAERRAT